MTKKKGASAPPFLFKRNESFMKETKELTEKNVTLRAEIYDWLESIVTAIISCILIFVFLGRIIDVDGISMVPTLNDRDKVLMSGLFYTPKQGDIIVLTKESFSEIPLVKRVIAVEGQTVDINFNTGEVSVDGTVLNEPYINEITHRQFDVVFPVTVPEGCIFVMGDNRNRSTDSRDSQVGFVDKRCVLGKVYLRIWPIRDIGIVSHG
jgi:signal peptidase I